MFNKIKLINWLKRIEQIKRNKTLITLRMIVSNKINIENRLKLLMRYKNEYIKQFNVETKRGILVFKLCNYNNFIAFLDYGIDNQQKLLKDNYSKYQHKLLIFQSIEYKLKMWDHFIMKINNHQLCINNFRNQVQKDALYVFCKNLFYINKQ